MHGPRGHRPRRSPEAEVPPGLRRLRLRLPHLRLLPELHLGGLDLGRGLGVLLAPGVVLLPPGLRLLRERRLDHVARLARRRRVLRAHLQDLPRFAARQLLAPLAEVDLTHQRERGIIALGRSAGAVSRSSALLAHAVVRAGLQLILRQADGLRLSRARATVGGRLAPGRGRGDAVRALRRRDVAVVVHGARPGGRLSAGRRGDLRLLDKGRLRLLGRAHPLRARQVPTLPALAGVAVHLRALPHRDELAAHLAPGAADRGRPLLGALLLGALLGALRVALLGALLGALLAASAFGTAGALVTEERRAHLRLLLFLENSVAPGKLRHAPIRARTLLAALLALLRRVLLVLLDQGLLIVLVIILVLLFLV